MTFSKVVSGIGGAPSGLLKSGTNIASKSGKDWVSYGGRRAALDPAITFWAPLNRDTQDELGAADTFTRASDGLYLPYNGADWRIVGQNVPRHENGQLLMEPAITNKCTNYNANPDVALTNMSVIGDAAGVLTRVYDPELIEESGLSNVCTSGYVFQLDNTAGSAVSYALVEGLAGVLEAHTASAFGVATVGNCYVRIGGVADSPAFPVGGAMRQRIISGTTVNVANKLSVGCDAGGVCRFVLTHYEESPVVTSLIITLGAAGQRAADSLTWAGADQFFNQTQGMALVTLVPGWNSDTYTDTSIRHILGLRQNTSLLYQQTVVSGTSYRFYSSDGPTFNGVVPSPSPNSGDVVRLGLRWKTAAPAEFSIGASVNGGSWVWSTETYDGGFTTDDILYLATLITARGHYSNLALYNEDRGTTWIEANYP